MMKIDFVILSIFVLAFSLFTKPSSVQVSVASVIVIISYDLEHVYMIPGVNSNRFEISNHFEMSFCLHGNLHSYFTAATF